MPSRIWSGIFDYSSEPIYQQGHEQQKEFISLLLTLPIAKPNWKPDFQPNAKDREVVFVYSFRGCFAHNLGERDLRTHIRDKHGQGGVHIPILRQQRSELATSIVTFAQNLNIPAITLSRHSRKCDHCNNSKAERRLTVQGTDDMICDACHKYYMSHGQKRPVTLEAATSALKTIRHYQKIHAEVKETPKHKRPRSAASHDALKTERATKKVKTSSHV